MRIKVFKFVFSGAYLPLGIFKELQSCSAYVKSVPVRKLEKARKKVMSRTLQQQYTLGTSRMEKERRVVSEKKNTSRQCLKYEKRQCCRNARPLNDVLVRDFGAETQGRHFEFRYRVSRHNWLNLPNSRKEKKNRSMPTNRRIYSIV